MTRPARTTSPETLAAARQALATAVDSAIAKNPHAAQQFRESTHDAASAVPLLVTALAERAGQVTELLGDATTGAEHDPLGWVSAEQQDALVEVFGTVWREPFAAELQNRWGDGWADGSPEANRARLDGLLPLLVMPFAEAGLSEEEAASVDEFVAEVQTAALDDLSEAIPQLAEELGLTTDELAQIVAEIPADAFAAAMTDQLEGA